MMDAYSNRLSTALEDALTAKTAELTRLLVGTPATDYAAYMQRVGEVRGIGMALDKLAELEAKLSAPEKEERPPFKVMLVKAMLGRTYED